MIDIHCSGCGRKIGVAPRSHYSVFCEESCAEDHPISDNEERDSVIEFLVNVADCSYYTVSQLFDVSRQRVNEIISKRKASA